MVLEDAAVIASRQKKLTLKHGGTETLPMKQLKVNQ